MIEFSGWDTINGFFCKRNWMCTPISLTVGVDGYVGTDWQSIIKAVAGKLEGKVCQRFLLTGAMFAFRTRVQWQAFFQLGTDPIFGKIYMNLIDFFDPIN
jgi:hypothetical protein